MSLLAQKGALIDGLLAVAERYDSFVFDRFGVLHDGRQLYPGVRGALRQLQSLGKPIVVLTNSGRTAAYNLDRLASIGLDGTLIDAMLTSGDAARERVLPRYVRDLGPNCYHIAPVNERPRELTAAVAGLRQAKELDACDFVYLSGMPVGLAETWQGDLLPRLISRAAPLLCSNPDFTAPGGDGLVTSPGTIAKAYGDAGGQVELIGKPYPLIYEIVRARLDQLGRGWPLFVGDSYHHDIAGARNAGFDACLVLTGIHQAQVRGRDILQTVRDELAVDGVMPTWITETL
jgi:HAD superfamily hydrolase (TIGR01459 family)